MTARIEFKWIAFIAWRLVNEILKGKKEDIKEEINAFIGEL